MKRLSIIFLCLSLISQACLEIPTPVPAATSDLVSAAGQALEQDHAATPTATETVTQDCATVSALQSLHLRKGGSEKAVVVGYLYHGDLVRIIDRSAAWWLIDSKVGKGYANSHYLQQGECHE